VQLKRIAQIIESNAVRQLGVAQAYRVTPGTKGAGLILRTGFARDFGNLMLGNEIADLAQNVKWRACWFGCFLFHPCRVAGRNGQANTFFSNFCGMAVTNFIRPKQSVISGQIVKGYLTVLILPILLTGCAQRSVNTQGNGVASKNTQGNGVASK
jgi:hypothetical protein